MFRPLKGIGQALVNMWRNKLVSFLAIVSVTASLTILGLVFSLVLNINSIASSAKDQFDTVTVFLKDGLPTKQVQSMIYEMEETPGVLRVSYESKEEALRNLKFQWKENAYLLEGLEVNPLPTSLIVTIKDLHRSDEIVAKAESLPGVEEVRSYQEVIDQLLSITNGLRKSGSVIIFILIGVSTVLIHNAIRMAVNSRENEIRIMKYIGATNWYIRWPFIIEGVLFGLIGAGVSAVIMYFGYSYVFEAIQSKFFVILSAYIVRPELVMSDVIFLFLVIGACIGALGSLISTRKPLNV